MKKRVKTIIFDWSGVFCVPGEPFSHPRLLKKLGKTPAEIESEVKRIQNLYYRGRISSDTFWSRVLNRFGIPNLLTSKQLTRAYLSSYKIDEKTLKIPKRLKKKYKVVLLSNLTNEMMKKIIRSHNIRGIFHHLVFSNKTGFLKPEEEIFRCALKLAGSKPEETVFVDDSMENVRAGQKLGITGIHFKSRSQLQKEFTKLSLV